MGHSLLYGVCGSFFASRALEQEYIPQAGTLVINSDPESDLSTAISADRARFVDGEFHCWFISGTNSNEFVDLSSRHYKKQVDALAMLPCRMFDDPTAEVPVDDDKKPLWRRDELPPEFVWVDDGKFPELVRAIPDVSACEFLAELMKSHKERIFAVLEIARARYEKATGSKML